MTGETTRRVTLGDQVRREALRRGGKWATQADQCARRAEAWYGRLPCKGEDLALVFGEVFRAE
ncbi:hypothetical protein [Paraburkholderia adhaesiva]|uniref:hypothetical protein n=1 Tax=Paraburkholderia adhaesiva TaxID=2883244 RepID=UPI001F251E7B|nr:hypothetical protein [Paraburkholderia adhaesiva]